MFFPPSTLTLHSHTPRLPNINKRPSRWVNLRSPFILCFVGILTSPIGLAQSVLGPTDYYSIGPRWNYSYTGSMVSFLETPLETHTPEPDWDTAYGGLYGRQIPPPELLQPRLDPQLQPFQPKYDRLKINGTRVAFGSEIMAEMCKRWSIGFRQFYNLAYFDCQAPFTGDNVGAALLSGNISVGFVGRELKPQEVINFHDKYGYPPTSIPASGGSWRQFAWLDVPVVIVHPSNPIMGMTFKQFDSIFSTTRYRGGKPIRTWGELPGVESSHPLYNQSIEIYGNAVWNGFEEFVRDKIMNVYPKSTEQPLNAEPALSDFNIYPASGDFKRGQWRSSFGGSESLFTKGGVPSERKNQKSDPHIHWLRVVFELAKAVSSHPNGIGYTGLAYVDSPVKILPLAVDDGGPFVGAGYSQVAAAIYPLSRVTYANVHKKPGQALEPVLEEFLRYIGSREGQQAVLDQGVYLPLRQFQVKAGQGRFLGN